MDFDLRLVGTVGGWNFDSEYVDYVLNKKKNVCVNVLIDSLGGYTNTGLSISGAFRNHGNVNVTFRGMNASAATIAALGAKHVAMEQDALYLIHKCSVMVFEWANMNEEQLAVKIAELEHDRQNAMKIDVAVARAYANKTGKTTEELLELMSKELWLTAEEALEYGFVDEIVSSGEKNQQVVITSSMENDFKQAGIPIPSFAKHEEDGFFQKLAKLFNSSNMEKNTTQQQTQSTATAGPTNEELQQTINDLSSKVTSLENSLQSLNDENKELKSTIDEMKSKVTEVTKNVINTPSQEGEENEFMATMSKARELSNLI